MLTILAWKQTRSAPKIPAFTAPDDDKEGSIDGDNNQAYDSVNSGSYPSEQPSVPYAAAHPAYSPGGFSAQAAARQSGTFYDGGRPFGMNNGQAKHVNAKADGIMAVQTTQHLLDMVVVHTQTLTSNLRLTKMIHTSALDEKEEHERPQGNFISRLAVQNVVSREEAV